MATLSEMFISDIMKQNDERAPAWDAAGDIARFAQLKQAKEAQAAQIQQRQQELQLAKLDKIGGWFETGAKMEDGPSKKAFMSKFLPNGVAALGMQDFFHPDAFAMAQGDPLTIAFMKTKTQEDPSYLSNTLIPAAADAEKFATLMASPEYKQFKAQQLTQEALQESIPALKKEYDKGQSEQNKMLRAQLVQAGAADRQKTGIESTGTVTVAKKVAEDFAGFQTGGGLSGAEAKIAALEKVAQELEDGTIPDSPITGKIPGLKGETAQAVINPKLKAAMDTVRGSMQLKKQLDSQFSAKEAEIAFSRAFDPALSHKQKATKIREAINEMRSDVKTKLSEFEAQGFQVKGGRGTAVPKTQKPKSPAETQRPLSDLDDPAKMAKLRAHLINKRSDITAMAAKYGLSSGQLIKLLGLGGQ